ncbi:hypothetical protein PInf_013639 [Phytophthora infestans]|nr:hypothetical protein PInf_013639 [Phytophthora infestans]
MECLEAHTRLEQKKKSVLRRQQRELQKQKQDVRAQEKELDKLALRCLEMEEEDRLSVAMEALHRDEEERKRMENEKETITLGLSASTPGVSGLQRLRLLEARIVEKELALKKSNEAKLRLDALPARRHKLTQLMHSFFSSSLGKKVERIVYQQHWDRLVPLFDVATASYGTRSTDLLNHESENGFTPVLITVFKGKPRVLRRLLELGASPDTETKAGMTPLLAAVMTGDVVALSILVEFKVDLNHETTNQVNAVLLAADKGREEILKALLQYGANVDGVNKAGRSTLIQAAISGNIDLFKILLAYGARKEHRDQGGKAALDWAVQLHNSAIVSALNRFLPGANLLAQLKAEEEEEEDGGVLSSLSTNRIMRQQRAAEMDRAMRMADVVRIRKLLSSDEFQLSPNYEDATGNSPLLVVCSIGTYADTVQCLKSFCIPTHQNREGVNALMIACKRGDVAMMQLLMTYGCNLLTRDFSGRDALHYLNAYDHPDLAIDFTNKYHKYHRENNRGLLLGRIVPTDNFVEPEYTISLVQVDISVGLGSDRDLSCRTVEEPGNAQFSEEDLVCDPVIRQWRIQQEKLKRDRKRRLQFDKERERILAARSRGRRNGMPRRSVDPEVDNYQRKKRIAKEKAISQMQVNVPVVAAKHAAQAGEETVFTQPAELELAALYTSQKKYERARELLGEVEKLILNSMGILHPTMLKVAIGKARISQENGDFEQCVCMMEDALSRVENALPLDHKDILTATSILLQSLDALEHYHRAVVTCRRVYHIRVRAVLPTHQCLKEICEQLDEFISKRETVDMNFVPVSTRIIWWHTF